MQPLRPSQLFPQSLLCDYVTINMFVDSYFMSHYWNDSDNDGVVP